MNQAEQAKIFIERALTIFRKVDDRRGEAWELFRLGETCLHLDQLEQALRYDEQALSIFREVGECIGEGVTINHLGLVYHRLGQVQKAARYYEQALDILREVNDFFGEGQTLLNISLLYSEMHRNDVVLASLLLARELFRNVQSLDYDRAQRQIETLREEIGERSFAALLRSVESQELQLVEQALLMDT